MSNLLENHHTAKTLAHAYFLKGENIETYIKNLFGDVTYEVLSYTDDIGIDTVRGISQKAWRTSLPDARHIILLDSNAIKGIAQSALLKIIEEPPPYTHFILYGASKYALIPPLRSRLLDAGESPEQKENPYKKHIHAFMNAADNPQEREAILEAFSDIHTLMLFLHEYESVIREKSSDDNFSRLVERLHTARTYLRHPIAIPSLIKDYMTLFL